MGHRAHRDPAAQEWAARAVTKTRTDDTQPYVTMPTDEEVVQVASNAAEGVIFSRYKQSHVKDVDVSVSFEDGILDIDVYLNVPDDVTSKSDPGSESESESNSDSTDPDQVTEDAALAAQSAVDELFATEQEE